MGKHKPTRRATTRKKLRDWSVQVRDQDGRKCCVCGTDRFVQAHHLISKQIIGELRFDPRIGISLCPTHHKFGWQSAHANPLWFGEWLKRNRPEQYALVLQLTETSLQEVHTSSKDTSTSQGGNHGEGSMECGSLACLPTAQSHRKDYVALANQVVAQHVTFLDLQKGGFRTALLLSEGMWQPTAFVGYPLELQQLFGYIAKYADYGVPRG